MNLVMLGPPGSGKGTLAEIIGNKFNIPCISTGNIIRNLKKSNKELGIKLLKFIEKGNLISDELMLNLLNERLNYDDCKNGFVLDGFPRTLMQAELLRDSDIYIYIK